ncbi:MAG: YebC/PmpR family DNA-binding transcriptional regulator [Candidatus Omnitrophica bacterium]|nr:YebC/PmpR family DNA-binding transcriptional regulator [Candidatus Omnitrophota bacterium]
MSGHSKWAGIKHKKALLDAKKGKVFTKVIKEITMAAKHGGGSPEANPSLRTAIAKAKEANMPSDNIDRAIKRGTGELPGVVYEEVNYEGYGPNGIAILVEVVTDNKNRTTAEVRAILSKKGGNLAGAGSVSWLFHKKGYIVIDKKAVEEDKLMSLVLESGAEDMVSAGNTYEVTVQPKDFENVKKALSENKITWQVAEITMIPSSNVKVSDRSAAQQVLGLVDALEEHDDVQNVYANFDIPDELLKEAAA